MSYPIVDKICSKRKFGLVEGELRGNDKSKLINPPIEIDDNYHWIRDDSRTNPKVLNHISNENNWTDFVMNPHKELTKSIYSEVKSYIRESYDTFASVLNDKAEWKYFRRYTEGCDYYSYWRKIILPDGTVSEEELLDINILAKDKPQCDVTSFEISPDHKLMTYGVDWDGSECYEFVLMDITTKKHIPTPIPKLAYCSYFWANSELIYYLVGDSTNRLYQLFLFNIVTGITQLIFEETNPEFDLNCGLSSDEKYVIISSGNYDSNWCKFIELEINPYEIKDFLPMLPDIKYSIESHESYWYVHTNYNASNWQVLKISKSTNFIWENLEQFIPSIPVVHFSSFGVYEKFFVFKTKIR